MSQLNCDIVKDLIPSYLENLCSESSRKAVAEHLTECAKCRDTLNMLQDTSLVSQKAEKKQLDFMKKVKQHYTRRNTAKILLLFILSLLILILSTYFFWGSTWKIILYYYTIFPILSLGTWLLLSDQPLKPKRNKFRIVSGIISTLGILTGLLLEYLMCYAINRSSHSPLPFGIALHQTGPVANFCLIAMAMIELLLFAILTADALKQGHSLGLLPTLSLTGSTLCLTFRLLLFYLDDLNTLESRILWINAVLLLETALVLVLEFVIWEVRKKRMANAGTASAE